MIKRIIRLPTQNTRDTVRIIHIESEIPNATGIAIAKIDIIIKAMTRAVIVTIAEVLHTSQVLEDMTVQVVNIFAYLKVHS